MRNNFSDTKYENFKENIYNTSFIVDDHILGDDFHSIILSLIDDFIFIAEHRTIHNLEIAQHYVCNSVVAQNCEIILRYSLISSDLSNGSLKFFIKYQKETAYHYVPIKVIRIYTGETCQKVDNDFLGYQNVDKMREIESQKYVAMSRAQTDAIKATMMAKDLAIMTPGDIPNVVDLVDQIVGKVRNTLTDDYYATNSMSSLPSKQMITIAKIIAAICVELNQRKKLAVVLIPTGNPSIKLTVANKYYQILVDADIAIVPQTCLSSNKHVASISPGLFVIYKDTDKDTINKMIKVYEEENIVADIDMSAKSFLDRIYKKTSNIDPNDIKILSNRISNEMSWIDAGTESDSDINLFTETEGQTRNMHGGGKGNKKMWDGRKDHKKMWGGDDSSSSSVDVDDVHLFTEDNAPLRLNAKTSKNGAHQKGTKTTKHHNKPKSHIEEESEDIMLFTEDDPVMFQRKHKSHHAIHKHIGGHDSSSSSSSSSVEETAGDVNLFSDE